MGHSLFTSGHRCERRFAITVGLLLLVMLAACARQTQTAEPSIDPANNRPAGVRDPNLPPTLAQQEASASRQAAANCQRQMDTQRISKRAPYIRCAGRAILAVEREFYGDADMDLKEISVLQAVELADRFDRKQISLAQYELGIGQVKQQLNEATGGRRQAKLAAIAEEGRQAEYQATVAREIARARTDAAADALIGFGLGMMASQPARPAVPTAIDCSVTGNGRYMSCW
jgi:hypothetical protein